MAVQKVSGTITFQDVEIEVKPFSEVHLFMLAEFIQNLKEACTTPEKWYATAALLDKLCPKLLKEGYVELDPLNKSGDLFLNGKQLQELYSGLYSLWETQTTETMELDTTTSDVPSDTIEALENRLAQMKLNAVELAKEDK
jgi:hypothetical protein